MDFLVTVNGRPIRVRLGEGAPEVEGTDLDVELAPPGEGPLRSIRVDRRTVRVIPARNGPGEWTLEVGGVGYRIEVLDPGEEAVRRARKSVAASGPIPVRAPMPGLVVRVEVSLGDVVESGQGVLIMEAMKMENELRSPGRGRVRAVHVRPGETVEKDRLLVELEPVGEPE